MLGTGKDQHLLPVTFANHLRQQFPLAFLIHKVNVLRHLLGSGVTACDFDFQRVVQQFFRQLFDLIREGRGEEQVLTLRRQLRQHAANIVDKAISSIRSASSSTRISTLSSFRAFWCSRSSRRPGVATRMSTPPRSFIICGLMLTPPKTTIERILRYWLYSCTFSPTCAASSRVGVRIRRVPDGGLSREAGSAPGVATAAV